MAVFQVLFLMGSLQFFVDSKEVEIPLRGLARPNFGVDFNFAFQVNNMHGTWKHTWTIDLSLLNRPFASSPQVHCSHDAHPTCKAISEFVEHVKQDFWNISQSFAHVHTWISDPRVLSTITRHQRRIKRSLLPFVGDIEKALFGVATESDIHAVKQTLEDFTKLGTNYKTEISKLGENLASVSKNVGDQMVATKAGFKKLHNMFGNLTSEINFRMKSFSNLLTRQAGDMSSLEATSTLIWPVLEGVFQLAAQSITSASSDIQLLSSIQTILQGYIPIELISPKELQEGLRVAEKGARSVFPSARLSYTDENLGYYYTHPIVTPYFDTNKILMIVDVPIDLNQQILNVYSILTFPVPIVNQSESTRKISHSELDIRDDYFLISQDGEYYTTATKNDLELCAGEIVRYCPKQFAVYPMSHPSCVHSLWMDEPFKAVLDKCPFTLRHHIHASSTAPYIQVQSLSNGRWFVHAPVDHPWTLVCPTYPPEVISPCTSCIIQVDCGCGIKSAYFSIPTRLSSCISQFAPVTRNFTVNPFSFVQHDHPWVLNITGTTVKPLPPQVVSDIHLPSSDNWDNVMDSMDRRSYDMNRIYQKQKGDTKMFRSESEAILAKIKTQDQILQGVSSWPDWIVGLGLGLSFVNSFLLVGFCWCFVVKGAHAIPIMQANRFQAEVPMGGSEEEIILSMDAIILIVCMLNLFLLLVLAWPILTAWITTNRYVRRYFNVLPRVNADGYTHRRLGTMLLFEGTGVFRSALNTRNCAFQINIVCMKAGCTLGSLQGLPGSASVRRVEGVYSVDFESPIFLTDDEGVEQSFGYVPVDIRRLHSKLHIHQTANLVSIINGRVILQRC